MTLSIGTLVISATGRDKDTVLAVIGVTESHLVLANGRKRRIEKPKHKQIKHVNILEEKLDETTLKAVMDGSVTNKMLYKGIRKSLKN